MNLFRRFQAGRHAHTLQTSGIHTPDDVAQAKDALIALGPAAIRTVFESVARGRPAAPAVEVLEQLVSNDTLDEFNEALRSPVPAVVEAASAALARSPNYDPTLLLPLFSDARVSKARLEGILTAQMQRVQAVTLVRLLPDLSKDARGSVFRLLEGSADSSIVQETVRLATNAEWWLRLHAVKLLAKFPSAPGTEGVTKLLNDENPAVRLEAVRALGTLQASRAIPALCQRLRDPDIRVQTAAVETLISLHDVAAVKHLLEYLKDESEYVRRGAVEVLNEVVNSDAIKDLVNALRDSDWWVRVRAADALGSLGGPKVIDAVIDLVKDPDEFLRRYAVEILNMVPDRRAVDALVTALEDDDWWVRERAIDALAKTGDAKAVEPLLDLMKRDERACGLCIKALANIPDARAVDPLCQIAESSTDPEARREAIGTLARYAKAELPPAAKDTVNGTLRRVGFNANAAQGGRRADFGPESGRREEPLRAPSTPRDAAHADAGARGQGAPTPGGRAREAALNFQRLEPETVLAERFRVIRRIGGGGFGTVYLVEDIAVREEVVLKVLSPHLSMDELMIRRFVQELRLSRRITHRNVIRIHDLIDVQGAHAISMEYFAARDLGTVLREEGALPAERVVGIASQIADGLAAAHDLGIIHRDIKPANVLLGDGDVVKIVDFGLASVGQSTRSRLTQSGILVGTPEYISPEQITGHDVDGRTDLYSFGVVLYELVSGRQPFNGPNAVNVLFQHLEPEVPPIGTVVNGLPPELADLIMRCMSRFPDDRPATARAVVEQLGRAA